METVSVMEKRVDILQNKVNNRIESSRVEVQRKLQSIEQFGNSLVDFTAPIGIGHDKISFTSNGSVKMAIGETEYRLHNNALVQMAEKLGIPTRFAKQLGLSGEDWMIKLLSSNFNKFAEHYDPKTLLFREADGEIRGVLSDKYRRLNTNIIYEAFLSSITAVGATVVDVFMDETRTSIDTVFPTVFKIPTEGNGVVPMTFGMRISNSDFGDGALRCQGYSVNVACDNGMTRDNILRQIHLGMKIPENISLSESTYRLDSETQASTVGDIVTQLYGKDSMEAQIGAIEVAARTGVDITGELKVLNKVGVLKSEVEQIQNVLTQGSVSDGVQGEPTKWKFANAITAVARDSEPRRKRELEDLAGKYV